MTQEEHVEFLNTLSANVCMKIFNEIDEYGKILDLKPVHFVHLVLHVLCRVNLASVSELSTTLKANPATRKAFVIELVENLERPLVKFKRNIPPELLNDGLPCRHARAEHCFEEDDIKINF